MRHVRTSAPGSPDRARATGEIQDGRLVEGDALRRGAMLEGPGSVGEVDRRGWPSPLKSVQLGRSGVSDCAWSHRTLSESQSDGTGRRVPRHRWPDIYQPSLNGRPCKPSECPTEPPPPAIRSCWLLPPRVATPCLPTDSCRTHPGSCIRNRPSGLQSAASSIKGVKPKIRLAWSSSGWRFYLLYMPGRFSSEFG